jgi:hypothetical protein
MKARIKNKRGYDLGKIILNHDDFDVKPSIVVEGWYDVNVGNKLAANGWLAFDPNDLVFTEPKDHHYNNDSGSLYLFAEQHGLNAWEFEVIKRIVRCRKKGEFISDIEKTKRVLDLYLQEQGYKYENQVEKLNR